MRLRRFSVSGIFAVILLTGTIIPGFAQNLQIMTGRGAAPLLVPMNRAVVVQSDRSFVEASIANPGIADISTLSSNSIYVLGKTPGRTTMTLLAEDGQLISNVEVQVTPDIAEFKERLQQILPGEKIEVRTANDGIVLSGTVSSLSRMDRALNLAARYSPDRISNLMVVGGTQQVMLKVRFAEMQRSVAKNLNNSMGVQRSGGGHYGGGTSGNAEGVNNVMSNSSVSSTNFGTFGFGFSVGSLEFGVLLEALESKGMVRTLAEPNLSALSGQEAKFLAGGEYPIPVSDDDGITVEYKTFGVELNFTPVVVDMDVINLTINAAVSTIDNSVTVTTDGFSVSAFKRRETSTTVEMRDGESFAIAGLLQDDFDNLNSQVPWLGNVPIIGALFRSVEYQRRQTELVIIVTPHLVTPTRGEALSLPTDRVRIPSDADMFLFGDTNASRKKRGVKGAQAEVAGQDFSGPYGYVME
jgi:pilus assembly protein CpaC